MVAFRGRAKMQAVARSMVARLSSAPTAIGRVRNMSSGVSIEEEIKQMNLVRCSYIPRLLSLVEYFVCASISCQE